MSKSEKIKVKIGINKDNIQKPTVRGTPVKKEEQQTPEEKKIVLEEKVDNSKIEVNPAEDNIIHSDNSEKKLLFYAYGHNGKTKEEVEAAIKNLTGHGNIKRVIPYTIGGIIEITGMYALDYSGKYAGVRVASGRVICSKIAKTDVYSALTKLGINPDEKFVALEESVFRSNGLNLEKCAIMSREEAIAFGKTMTEKK